MTIKTRRITLLISCLVITVSVILMAQPNSTTLTFAPGPNETAVASYSFFSFMHLIGYGQYAPVLTAVSCIIWISVSCYKLLFDKKMITKGPLTVIFIVCLVFSAIAIATTITPTCFEYLICFVIAIAGALQILAYRGTRQTN